MTFKLPPTCSFDGTNYALTEDSKGDITLTAKGKEWFPMNKTIAFERDSETSYKLESSENGVHSFKMVLRISRAIYTPGSIMVHSETINGVCPYSKKTTEELLNEYPGSICETWEVVWPMIHAAQDEKYLGDVSEVSKEDYWEMLEVLPPLDYNGTHFCMSEMQTDTITAHYGKQRGRYFHQTRRRGNMRGFETAITAFIAANPTSTLENEV